MDKPDPSHDYLGHERRSLDPIFSPKAVALIGATEREGSVGRTLLENLGGGQFKGAFYAVNPARKTLLGHKAVPRIEDIPSPVDLAVIATPAPTIPGVIRDCVAAKIPGAIIISAGFKEIGSEGVRLEQQIQEAANGRIRIIGPNCLGIMRPSMGLNATFAGKMALPGKIGFISQSGALCTSILDWSLRENVGFSAFVSIGSMLDIHWGDLIDYLGNDHQTRSILIYMESIGNARAFLSAAREIALTKPIIIMKAGRTQEAAKAAASHTGAMAGSDDVFDAAFRRSGVMRVYNISDLFNMAEVLGRQPRPRGRRLGIITNAGGPGVLATDTLILGGGELAPLSEKSINALNEILPSHWSHGNPVDVLGDALPDRYLKAVDIVAKDPMIDGLLVILTPQAMTDPTETARVLSQFDNFQGKPFITSWMGGNDVAAGEAILNKAGIPTFAYPDDATRVFNNMWQYSDALKGLYETPSLAQDLETTIALRSKVHQIIYRVHKSGRTILTEAESKELLSIWGIPVTHTRVATSDTEAIQYADEFGYPVVLKLLSETITHKTDVGGVRLNLESPEAVRDAYLAIKNAVEEKTGPGNFLGVTVQPMIRQKGIELIVGMSCDAEFGPVLLFGTGGTLVEIYKDRSLGLPPLNTTLAVRLMERTKIYRALQGHRRNQPQSGVEGEAPTALPVEGATRAPMITELARILVQFSNLVVTEPLIREIDINPLMADASGITALDARIILHEFSTNEKRLPRPVIRPYPLSYISTWELRDGTPVTIRPIRPEDEPSMIRFHETLSDRSIHLRYFESISLTQRTAHERLTRICFVDYDREMLLVAELKSPSEEERAIIAVGRLSRIPGKNEAEFALLISDPYQGRGLGLELLRKLVEIGRAEDLDRITGFILKENQAMRKISQRLGFKLSPQDDEIFVELKLKS